ncbi:MAG: host attachment protein [Alphaproteobacteria bacterium]
MKPIITWILIADGTRAKIVANPGPGRGLQEVPGQSLEASNLLGRDIMADRPGRTHDRFGPASHAMEPTSDPRRLEKNRFAAALADSLHKSLEQKAFERLVLVASPAMLGDLRAAISASVAGVVTGEIPKDLTQLPVRDLPKHLETVLAV